MDRRPQGVVRVAIGRRGLVERLHRFIRVVGGELEQAEPSQIIPLESFCAFALSKATPLAGSFSK
jgi:hypothetical protein